MGADRPYLTVYESRNVIFWKDREYKIAQLDLEEMNELIYDLRLSDTFFLKSRRVSASNCAWINHIWKVPFRRSDKLLVRSFPKNSVLTN
jgi:hypothetical protein